MAGSGGGRPADQHRPAHRPNGSVARGGSASPQAPEASGEARRRGDGLGGAEVDLQVHCMWFARRGIEEEYLATTSGWRWPVLLGSCCFDAACLAVRSCTYWIRPYLSDKSLAELPKTLWPQILIMVLLYALVALLDRRSLRRHGFAAKQEDFLLSMAVASAMAMLLATLNTSFDYVYVCFFLISATTLLNVRWWVGVFFLGPMVATACCWRGWDQLPAGALTHLVVAWGCGVMLSYQTDYCRRQMFAFQHRANAAHKREIEGREARRKVEGELAAIQAEFARRNKQIARKKAAIEEKSELMRVMCHEVRTPLNSCLASAEMLLDTPLQEEQRDHAQTIRLSGSILLSTVSTFLDYFKLEAGRKLEIGLTEVNLPALLSQLHSIIQAMIGTNTEVDLTTPRMPNVPEVVLSDPGRLRGVILNLYTNAAKCTRRGFIDLNVSVIDRPYAVPPGPGYSNVMVSPSSPQGASEGLAGLNTSVSPSQGMSLTHRFMRDRPSVDYTVAASLPEWETDLPEADNVRSAGSGTVWANNLEVTLPPWDLEGSNSAGGGMQHGAGTWVAGRAQPALAQQQGQRASSDGGHEGKCPEWVLFEIADSGMGISKNELKSLFQEYATVGMSHPKTLAGTGLGLSICSKQVDMLGGRIGAYSKLNAGSVFWFTIPLIEASRKHASIRRLGSHGEHGGSVWRPPERLNSGTTPSPAHRIVSRKSSHKRGKALDTSGLQGLRVLLAEDDVLSQNVTRKMLTSWGMKCTVVSNGKEAVDLLTPNSAQEAAFDVVLMDMLMPTMDGIKATQEIRKKGVRVPIIAMTANSVGRDSKDCRAAGMDAFLSKPVFKAPLAEALLGVSTARGHRRGAANA